MAVDFSNLFGGDDTTGINALLTPAQRALMERNAGLSAAAALLQASGPSRQRIGLGQALGAALQSGQGAYEKARAGSLQDLLLGVKLQEAQDERARNAAYMQMLGGGVPAAAAPTTTSQTPLPRAPSDGPGVQVFAPDAPVMSQAATPAAPNMFTNLTADQRRILALMPRAEGLKLAAEALKPPETVGEPFRGVDGNTYIRTKTGGVIPAPVAPAAKPVGTPQQVMGPAGKPQLVQYYDDGSYQAISGVSPLIPRERIDTGSGILIQDPYAITPGTVIPKGLAPQVVGNAEEGFFVVGGGGGGGGGGARGVTPRPSAPGTPSAGAPTPVTPTAGPTPIIPGTGKGFAREKDLRTEFTQAMKPFTDLAQAFTKVEAAALNPSAAGDISLVYGYMKILDPGSTVMQGEQATASNAGGIPDRIRAVYNKALTGETLAPTVRQDFYAQAQNLIGSQRQLQQDIASRYANIATQNKLDPNQIIFDPFQRIEKKSPKPAAAKRMVWDGTKFVFQ